MPRHLAALTGAFVLFIPGGAIAASYAPIDCAKAETPAQHTICRVYSLGQAEARVATLFGVSTSLVAMGQRGDIEDQQSKWLKQRDACGADVACLSKAYAARLAQLNETIDQIASGGPY